MYIYTYINIHTRRLTTTSSFDVATGEHLALVHTKEYIVNSRTIGNADAYTAAVRAVGAVCHAVDEVYAYEQYTYVHVCVYIYIYIYIYILF